MIVHWNHSSQCLMSVSLHQALFLFGNQSTLTELAVIAVSPRSEISGMVFTASNKDLAIFDSFLSFVLHLYF